jgi:hypothetical protein
LSCEACFARVVANGCSHFFVNVYVNMHTAAN